VKKSTLLHLRIPFSFFLLPVFLLACAVANEVDWQATILAFIAIHLFIYPASNGYNSYFDKDEDSIGGLKNPPPVSGELYYVSLLFDAIGLLMGWWISWQFALMLFIYGLISKAYSHPSVRLKKRPVTGWLAAGIFQGYFTFLMSYIAVKGVSIWDTGAWFIQWPGILSSLLLLGSYPMTQVYQHDEDARRGDLTLSRMMGVKGTFHFTMIVFGIATFGYCYYFFHYHERLWSVVFPMAMSPVLLYFFTWYALVRQNERAADFRSTMRLNLISSLVLNVFFALWWWL
jgi:1,4-dihydroxy-2-naphthoate octaprenyltransferase